MQTLTFIPETQQTKSDSYLDGEFDAAIALPPKTYAGEYWRGYLAKVNETGNTPF